MEVTLLITRIILILLLYAFLGAIIVLLWRDLRNAAVREAPPSTPERAARLVIVEGIDGLEQGATYSLKTYTSIGRAARNIIALPDTYCSAEHALVVWRDNQWWLEDRDSRNGTLLNGQTIEAPTIVSHGDEIRFGRISMRFEIESSN
jgi:pSer/pThr/pTyr-binding forkhead associated (FHA) protein